jgi:hypothetical protein
MEQDMNIASKTVKNARFRNNLIQGLVTLLVALIVIGTVIAYPILAYHTGLENWNGPFSEVFFLMFLLASLSAIALIFFQIIFLIVILTRAHSKHGLDDSRIGWIPVLFCLASILLLVVPFFVSRPGYQHLTEGFRDRMERDSDVGAIQRWLQTIKRPTRTHRYILDSYGPAMDPEFYGPDTSFIKSFDPNDWPEAIRILSPKVVYISPYGSQEVTVRLEWNNLIASWGLVVGSIDMSISESEMLRGKEYRLKLAQGAYVWHDIR